MDRGERLSYLRKKTNLSERDIDAFTDPDAAFSFDNADQMIENTIGIFSLPLGIATKFVINGREHLIPMVTEEPSVIAAASNAAKIASKRGGFTSTTVDEALMIGQVQLVSIPPVLMGSITKKISHHKSELLSLANSNRKSVIARDLQIKEIEDKSQNMMGKMLIVELLVDTKDAMGANVINSMCEAISPRLEVLTGGKVIVRILSNYSTRRLVSCKAIFARDELGGEAIVDRILYAYAFAYSDPYRAVTHNKGIMNGIDAVALATGQDFRAIEAAAHAYAARDGTYRSMTRWYKTKDGDLAGHLELPLAVGTVGGIVSIHPMTKLAIKILGVKTAKELAAILVAVGLAQNFAAMKALVSEGIQTGHMRLHARNIAVLAGARGSLIKLVAQRIADEKNVNIHRAQEIIALMTGKNLDNNTYKNNK
ncbi:MAG TPA: hydroxymethylglutaryl-CoA reductase, degradative [Candidatus Nitrosopolaris sp.]|nr:hydroxymethylglutaryl-CoA reductase, degradative [Candidatus Nitrosopolaris sp.]